MPSDRAGPGRGASTARGALPKPLTSLVGRDADVAAARALLVDGGVRLLTLIGPGGVGKSRLASRIAEDVATAFADGVVFVPLAPIADPDLVAPTIARELGLRDAGAQPLSALLADYLRDKRLLLVLDNFEQVRSAATQIAALLGGCLGVVALVTSRARLHVAGEQRFPVAPLALPDCAAPGSHAAGDLPFAAIAASTAVQLFVARARAVDPRFILGAENAAAIAAICRRLDGLPLAIELTAARSHLLAPADLLARLSPALPLLTDGPADAPNRQRTMRDAIAWSYDLLLPDEQALFRRLSIFVGGFTMEAAAWTTAGSPSSESLALVASLVETSLLHRDVASAGARFGMLETIREFGLERLADRGEMAGIAARHAAWCAHLAESVRRSGRLSQGRGLAALEAEHPNLRAALGWLLDRGETTAAQHLAAQLAEFWLRHIQNWSEGQGWLERALAGDARSTVARAEALVGLSMLQWPQDAYGRAAELLAEAEAVGHAVGDAGAVAYARLHQGYVALFQGDFDLAIARGEECLETCHAIAQEFSCNGARWLLARTELARGDDQRAAELYGRLLVAAYAGGDEISIANGHFGLAMLAERRGDWADMLTRYAEAAAVSKSMGDVWFATHSIDGVAAAAAALGRMESAVRLFAAAAALRGSVTAAPTPPPIDPQHQKHALAAAGNVLDAERFAACWAAGAALSLDEAITEGFALAHPVAAAPGAAGVPAGLTPREHEVLRQLASGMTDKEIAVALGIGRRTDSSHVKAIRAKLDAPSRTAAVAIAVRDRLV